MPEGLEGGEVWSGRLWARMCVFQSIILSGNWQCTHKTRNDLHFCCIQVVIIVLNHCQLNGKEKPADLCWCAAPWCHFLCLWGKRGGSGPGGRQLCTVCFPWQLEDIQLLRILLLNAIQIFGIQVHFFLSRLSLIPFSWKYCHVSFQCIQRWESHAACLLFTLILVLLFPWGFFSSSSDWFK